MSRPFAGAETMGAAAGGTPRSALLHVGLLAALVAAAGASLAIGAAPLPLGSLVAGLFGQGDPAIADIVREIRLPRVLLGLVVGASLGLSGAAMQGLFRNPLAEPGLTGASASAGLGAVIAIYYGWAAAWPLSLPLVAMATAAVPTGVLLAVTTRHAGTFTLILAGIALSSLAIALTSLAMNLSPDPYAVSEMVLWLFGSLRDRGLADVGLAAPFAALGWLLLAGTGRGLDALTLGEEVAASLGVDLRRLKLQVIMGTALTVGAAVAVAGSIGFVGLVVPHLARPFVGHRPSAVLLPGAVGGALLVTVADIAVRLIPVDNELMLGVLTALVGAPFFLFLILKHRWGEP